MNEQRRAGAATGQPLAPSDGAEQTLTRRTIHRETAIVILLTLGASAIWAILSLVEVLTRPDTSLAGSTTRMNTNKVADRLWLDLVMQLTSQALKVVPVLLVLYLLSHTIAHPHRHIGFDFAGRWRDVAYGAGLAALIGIPGLGLYVLGRELGWNMRILPANLKEVWWAVPVLILAALVNAVVEEVVGPGYLLTRWEQAGWPAWLAVAAAAVLRGAYHLYQGFGQAVGNVIMGLIFGAFFLRTRRVMPLVIAHALIDIVAFVGSTYLMDRVSWLAA